MKRVLSILIFFFSILHCYSQENVFILVDVSKSGAKKLKEKGGEGEKLIKSVFNEIHFAFMALMALSKYRKCNKCNK